MTEVMVGMASIPERASSLERALASLSPQAARIDVALNEYTEVPAFFGRWNNVFPRLTGPENQGDAEKFLAVDDWDGIVATCDDDILYPSDYIQALVDGLERWPGRAVSFHGGTTLGWNGQTAAASHKRVRCLHDQDEDDGDVNVVGTGVLAYDTRHVPMWRSAHLYPNMADVGFAVHARELGIKMACLRHRAGWLTDICPPVAEGRRIYDSSRNRDGTRCDNVENHDREIRRHDWLTDPPPRPRVHVAIGTCDRPDELRQLLDDLTREAQWVDLRVHVYEDPTGADYQLPQRMCRRRNWPWHTFPTRLGRRGYWQMVDRQLRDAKPSDADWYMFLPDDIRLVRHAIPRAIRTWNRLEDPATLTLWRLNALEGLKNWTDTTPIPGEFAAETFHVDGCHLSRRDALAYLGFQVKRPAMGPTGSGVGRYLSRTLHNAGARMYRVNESVATCNDGGRSVMNPEERVRHPSVSLNQAATVESWAAA